MNTNPATGQTTLQGTSAIERGAVANKWGSALDAGFQVVPSVLIKAQSRLGLDAVDCMVLLNLNLHWWQKDNLPYPPPALIARRMGVSRRTVERRLFRLQKAGWVKRLPAVGMSGQPKVRKYDLSGMGERLQQAAIIGVNQGEYRTRLKSKSKPPQTLADGRYSTNTQSRDLAHHRE
jgi:DnaD-like protein